MLPNDFPPYQTVYYWFRRLVRRLLFRTIHDLALMLDRMCEQREVVPSAGIVDSQSVKAPGAHERGYDAHKKISGRKRHIAVDTDGRLLAVNLTPADIADSTGAQLVLDALVKRWPWIRHLFGDAAYDRRTLLDKAAYLDFTVEIVRGLQSWDAIYANEMIDVGYSGEKPRASVAQAMNIIMVNPGLAIVEERQKPLIKQLNKFGVEVAALSMRQSRSLCGGFHCATLDVRRAGTLQNYS